MLPRLPVLFALVACGPDVPADDTTADSTTATTTAGPPDTSGSDTDAQADVTSATTESTGSESADPTGNGDARPDHFELTRVIDAGPWDIIQDAAGIAVDANERLFIADGTTVWLVVDGEVSNYLDPADGIMEPLDIDVGTDGTLYILESFANRISTSVTSHTFVMHRSLADVIFPANLGIVDDDVIAMTNWYDGLWQVTSTANTLIYDDTMVMGGTNCATEDLAVQSTGAFLYQPGCNGSPIVMGSIDGSGVRVMYGDDLEGVGSYANAMCSSRAPGGDFYSVISYGSSTPTLHYVPETAADASSWQPVETIPTLAELMSTTNEVFGFYFCSIAVSPSSTLYLQTGADLWIGSPVF